MNVKVLIDAIVRQNMVLVAQLSTIAGVRAPLAHVANQVFLKLVQELEAQGLRQKVIADMFGLALRSYQRKVQRLLESETERGRSLWEAILTYVQDKEVVSRAEVLRRFRNDDDGMVRGVLDDLVNTGLLYRRGKSDSSIYRYADDDAADADSESRTDADTALVWVAIYRDGPLSREALGDSLRLDPDAIDRALTSLLDDGRVEKDRINGKTFYRSNAFFTAYGEPSGWEAALFDHYQAVVAAICTKLRVGSARADHADVIGGSTYSYDIWRGHPFEERVLGMLRATRDEADTLLEEVHRYNSNNPAPTSSNRVSFYVGQSVSADDEEEYE